MDDDRFHQRGNISLFYVPSTPSELRRSDIVRTTTLTLISAALCPLLYFGGLIGQMAYDPCSSIDCNYRLGTWGVRVSCFGPIVVFAVILVVLVLRFRRQRTGWWIALVGIGVMLAVSIIGGMILDMAIPNPGETLF